MKSLVFAALTFFALLGLLGTAAQASTFQLPLNGEVIFTGPFNGDDILAYLSMVVSGGDYIDPVNTDEPPYEGYFINVYADNATLQACEFSQDDSICGRGLTNQPTTGICACDGELFISTSIEGFGVTPITVLLFATLPDGFYIAGTPLPGTLPLFLSALGILGLATRKIRPPYCHA